MGKKVQQASITTIAQHAGVSIATVQRALSGQGRISEATRVRVRAIADEFGYQPNRLARALRTKRTGLIGIVFPSMFNPIIEPTLHRAASRASEQGYNFLFSCPFNQAAKEREMLEILCGTGIEGMLLFPSAPLENRDCYRDVARRIPMVLVEQAVPELSVDVVRTDNVAGGYQAGQLLLRQGCRRLAFLMPNDERSAPWWGAERLRGCRQAVTEAGLTLTLLSLSPSDENAFDYDTRGEMAIRRALTAGCAFDGLVAANDTLAIRALHALQDSNIRVPDNVAVVGFDDTQMSATSLPSLTTFRPPMEQIGDEAIRVLFHHIRGELPAMPPQERLVPPQLIRRISSGGDRPGPYANT